MEGKIKSLIVACLTLLLCTGIVTASTYAIFTDGANVTHHLVAGTLDVTLERTSLERVVLNEAGELETVIDDSTVSFTDFNTTNIFGIKTDEVVVPGTKYTAYLTLGNDGNVAFDYTVKIVVHGDASGDTNELAEQLIFTATEGEETLATLSLAEIKEHGLVLYSGSMNNTTAEKSFSIAIEFVTLGEENDAAQDQEIYFDLVVEAVQKTATAN